MADPQLATCIFTPDEMVSMLKDMHIDAVSLANNHSCDCDIEGLYHTMDVLDKAGIAHFGAGRNSAEASAPAVLNVAQHTICLLGYLQEYEYLYRGEGYHPTDTKGGVNIFNIDKAVAEIKEYKEKCDYVFVMPHWGMERSMVPLYKEVCYAKRMIDAGADGVIGSHAHIVQPVFEYKGKTIAMNLGNFAFPDRYVIPPRLPYYPTADEIQKDIPKIYSFKLVDQLSLKIVAEPERKGMILGINYNNECFSFNVRNTILSKNNLILFDDSYKDSRVSGVLTNVTKSSFSFVLLLINFKARLPYVIKGFIRKIKKCK